MTLRGLFFGFSADFPYFLLCSSAEVDGEIEVCLAAKPGHRLYPEEDEFPPDTRGVPEGCAFAYSYRKKIPVSVLQAATPWTLPGETEPARLPENHDLFTDVNYIFEPEDDPRLDEIIACLTAT